LGDLVKIIGVRYRVIIIGLGIAAASFVTVRAAYAAYLTTVGIGV
jgi:hypothetical protein